MKKLEAVIFDMDGLMFETEKLWLDASKVVNKKYGYKVPPKVIISSMGLRKDGIIKNFKERLGNDFKFEEYDALIHNEMRNYITTKGLKKKKGLIEILEFLKSKNVKMAVASSSKKEKIKLRLTQTNISESYFDAIISGDMVEKAKPNPEIYLKAIKELNINPENALALEDSEYGLEAAHMAGLYAILIPDIKKPCDRIKNMAYRELKSLKKAIKVIKKEFIV